MITETKLSPAKNMRAIDPHKHDNVVKSISKRIKIIKAKEGKKKVFTKYFD